MSEQMLETDYQSLREAMLASLRQMAGDSWTNYNESDPGVTIAEQLCYALTELGLRAERPVRDFLAEPDTQTLQLQRQGLVSPQAIIPGPALTDLDQRRWLLDQVPGLANVWLSPQQEGIFGLYRLEALPQLPQMETCLCPSEVDGIKLDLQESIKACASRLRNLGEDLERVEVLEPLPLRVHAKVSIESHRQHDEIQAEILYRLGLFLAPEPRRRSLAECLTQGMTLAEYLDGPPVSKGFIGADELTPKLDLIKGHDIRKTIASIQGVLDVEELSFSFADSKRMGMDDKLPINPGTFPFLANDPYDEGNGLRLFRNQHLLNSNPERVVRVLRRFWMDHRQTFNLNTDLLRAFPPLLVGGVEDGKYESVHSLFPVVYGLRPGLLLQTLSPERLGQILQLKGYLLVFDQLLANFAAQLSFLRELFSLRVGGDHTLAYRSLREVAGWDGDLLVDDYDTKLADCQSRLDSKQHRQAMVLDFLLAIYGQHLSPIPMRRPLSARGDECARRLLQAKRELLRDVARFTRERGSGINYRTQDSAGRLTALERRCAMELAMCRAATNPAPVFLVPDVELATFGQRLVSKVERGIWNQGLPLDGWWSASLSEDESESGVIADPFSGQLVASVLWPSLSMAERFRIRLKENEEGVDLLCADENGDCWRLEVCTDAGAALAVVRRLFRWLGVERNLVFVIESVLLRHAFKHASADVRSDPWFDARILLVLMGEPDDEHHRKELERLFRPHVPAHLELEVLVVEPRRFPRFLRLREAWLRSFSSVGHQHQASASRRLTKFLRGLCVPPPLVTLIPVAASFDALGAICKKPVSLVDLHRWRRTGLRFVMRPLTSSADGMERLSAMELIDLARERLALMPFQDRCIVTADELEPQGRCHGQRAIKAARKLRLPPGVVIWLEGPPTMAEGERCSPLPFLEQWCQTIHAGGYASGIFLTSSIPIGDLSVEWLCHWIDSAPMSMMGYVLKAAQATSAMVEVGVPEKMVQIQANRSGLTPKWVVPRETECRAS